MCEALAVSERRACRVLGQVRRTQRYAATLSDDETVLVANVVSLATEYGRYGYRRITALLRADGWRPPLSGPYRSGQRNNVETARMTPLQGERDDPASMNSRTV